MAAALKMRKKALAIVGYAAVLAAVFALGVVVVVPAVMGWVPLTVLTGSMSPHIKPGSQVMVERVDINQARHLRLGQIVTYMPNPDDPMLVTHRVVAVNMNGEDDPVKGASSITYTLKGDANSAADPQQVHPKQIRGIVRYHVPYAGYVANALSIDQKRAVTVVCAGLLLAYAGYQVLRAVSGRKRGRGRGRGRHAAMPHHMVKAR